jgi:hypothetical protein
MSNPRSLEIGNPGERQLKRLDAGHASGREDVW